MTLMSIVLNIYFYCCCCCFGGGGDGDDGLWSFVVFFFFVLWWWWSRKKNLKCQNFTFDAFRFVSFFSPEIWLMPASQPSSSLMMTSYVITYGSQTKNKKSNACFIVLFCFLLFAKKKFSSIFSSVFVRCLNGIEYFLIGQMCVCVCIEMKWEIIWIGHIFLA